jgi:hypothetical protein
LRQLAVRLRAQSIGVCRSRKRVSNGLRTKHLVGYKGLLLGVVADFQHRC